MQTVRSHSHEGCYQNAGESWKGGRENRGSRSRWKTGCASPALFPLGCPEVALGVAVLDGWPWVWWVWMGSAGHGDPGLGGSGCGDPGWVALRMVALGMTALDVVALGMMALGGWRCEQQ